MQKTLYVSDLDGTLLLPEECLSPFTAETIQKLTSEGMLFSYATARSLTTARKVTGALGALHIPVILNNGGTIADAADGHVLEAAYFSEEEIGTIRNVLTAAGLSPLVYSRPGEYADRETVAYVPRNISRGMQFYLNSRKNDERFNLVEPEQLYEGKIFYFAVMQDTRAACEAVHAVLAADPRFSVYLYQDIYSAGWYFEIAPSRTKKAIAVQRLAGLYGCDRIVCFGDGVNDLSMFRIADVGYAVENAHADLKAEATGVIGPNTADGVAHKLIELWRQDHP